MLCTDSSITVPESAKASCAAREFFLTLRPKSATAITTTGMQANMTQASFHENQNTAVSPPTRITICRTACGTVVIKVSRTTVKSAATRVLSAPDRWFWKNETGSLSR